MMQGEASQFSQAELKEISEEIVSQHFPSNGMGTELKLLVVDPYHLHAYWNINLFDIDCLKQNLGQAMDGANLALRIYDVTCLIFDGSNAHSYFDILVQGLRNNWYANVWSPDKSFIADLGFRLRDGRFILLARSNVVFTPRASQSAQYSTEGLEIKDGLTQAKHISQISAMPYVGVRTGAFVQRTFSAEEIEKKIEEYYQLKKTGGRLFSVVQKEIAKDELSIELPRQIEEINKEQPRKSSERKGEIMADKIPKSISPTEHKSLPKPLGGSENLYPSSSSFSRYVNDNLSDVIIEINAEVRIYGRAKLGGKLQIAGEEVPLNPDGTFSITRFLPNGALLLPLLADLPKAEQKPEEQK